MRDRKWRHRKYVLPITRIFPALFSYNSSSTKCTIAHDRHGYWMWCDRKWPVNVTRSDVIKPEVGVSRPFFACFRIFSRFLVMLCSIPRVLSITSAGNDRTGSMPCAIPAFSSAFFLAIVVGQNIRLRMTDKATGCDVTESHVTWSGDFLLSSGVFEYFRDFWLWTMLCSTPLVLSITSAFSLVFLLNNLRIKWMKWSRNYHCCMYNEICKLHC